VPAYCQHICLLVKYIVKNDGVPDIIAGRLFQPFHGDNMQTLPGCYQLETVKKKAVYSYGDAGDARDIEASPDRMTAKRFGRLTPFLSKLFASGVEARGVERIPENQRVSRNAWNKYISNLCSYTRPECDIVSSCGGQ